MSTPTPLQSFSNFISNGDSTHLSDLPAELSALSPLSHTESDMDTDSFSNDSAAAGFPANDTLTRETEVLADAYATDFSDTSMPHFDLSSFSDSSMDGIDLPSLHAPKYLTEDSIDDSLPVEAIAADTQDVQYKVVAASSEWRGDKTTDSLGSSLSTKADGPVIRVRVSRHRGRSRRKAESPVPPCNERPGILR